MNNFNFCRPTDFYFGKGQENEVGNICKKYNAHHVLLHFGGKSALKSGLIDKVEQILIESGLECTRLGGVLPNPRADLVYEGIKLCKNKGIDLILAVGGGSVIDSAKAIAMGVPYEGDFWDFFMGGKIPQQTLPVGCILTIAAAGSEGSNSCVIEKEVNGIIKKKGCNLQSNVCTFSILNPEYTYSVSQYQMVSGIFDIMSHLMEQYFSGDDDNVSDYLIEALLKNLIVNTKKALNNPKDYEARSNIMWDATLALNTLVGLSKTQDWEVHMIEHQLGAYTDCAHGMGLACISIPYYKHIYKFGLKKFVSFALNVWNVEKGNKSDDEIALEGIDALAKFIKDSHMVTTLKELNATKDMLLDIANSCYVGGGYKKIDHKEIYQILLECYE